MTASRITLVPYTSSRRSVNELAAEISRCLSAAPGGLRVDFPQVFPRYSSPRQARKSAAEVYAAMQDVSLGFGAYTIEVGGVVVGVASYMQRTTVVPSEDDDGKTVNGPLISAWLSLPSVCDRPRHLLPALLESGAKILLANKALSGTPWTVVNTNNTYVIGTLTSTPVLGGFAQVGEEGVFEHLDGSQARRRLFVCASTLQDLRAAAV